VHAVAADRASATLLRIAAGVPLLAVDRVAYTYGDRPVEVRRGLCTTRHEHYWNTLT
jgi:GntR family transcriptional regulator